MKKRLLSLALAVLMIVLAIPAAVLPLSAVAVAEGVKVKDTFDLATEYALDCTTNTKDTSILKLYKWYFADGTPVKGESAAPQAMNDDCYATYHPDLIAAGVFSATDSYETILGKYADYLKSKGNVQYAGDWELATLVPDGRYQKIEHRLLAVTQSIYAVRMNSKAEYIMEDIWYEENGRVTSSEVGEAFIDAMIEKSLDAIQVGDDGKIFLSELKGDPLFNSYLKASINSSNGQISGTTVWHDGGYFWNWRVGGFQLNGNADPTDGSTAAYTFVVPEKVDGKISLSMANIYFPTASQASGNSMCVTKNGEVVWPAGAVLSDISSYYQIKGPGAAANLSAEELTKLNDALATIDIEATTGDKISFVFARTNSTRSRLQASPSVSYEKKVSVQYLDKDGELLATHIVNLGAAMPKAPFAADEAGYLINGTAATTLPETVEGDLTVQYAGEYAIADAVVEKVGISVATDFSVNLYVRGDEYAQRVGVAGASGKEYWGTQGADGLWKITVPGYAAKDMGKTQKLWMFQEFSGGMSVDTKGAYEFVPNDILAAYADSDASASEKAIAAASLDYTAAAAAYFADEALEEDVKARLAAQDAAIAALESDVELADSEDYCINGMTLVLKDQVAFKVRVASSLYLELEAEVLDYTVSVEGNGTANEYTGFVFTEGDEGYSVTMSLGGIAPADFDATYTITVKDTSFFDVSEAFEYSVNDYIARTFDANAKEADLLRAIYALGVAANA